MSNFTIEEAAKSEGMKLKEECMARAKARREAREAERLAKVAWQDLMFQEYKDLITVEGFSIDDARAEMTSRASKFLDGAQFLFLDLITNSKPSDF